MAPGSHFQSLEIPSNVWKSIRNHYVAHYVVFVVVDSPSAAAIYQL